MIAGFDKKLTCEGVIGDGCGGGRLFSVQNETLKAYDPQTKEYINLLEGVFDAISISKRACKVTIVCKKETIVFDLSKMSRV